MLSLTFLSSLIPAAWLLLTNPQRSWVDRSGLSDLSGQRPQDWFVLALITIACGTVLLCWIGGRTLARAPLPADTPDRLAVRHAIRSAAALSVVGGATMICGAVTSKLAWPMNTLAESGSVLGWIAGLLGLVGLLVATWGALLTLTSIPHFAPFAGRLPSVPNPEPRSGT